MPQSARHSKSSKRQPDFCIVGSGQLARVLAHALHRAGFTVAEIVTRNLPESKKHARTLARQVGAAVHTLAAAELSAAVLWLCIPDDYIPQCAQAVAAVRPGWENKIVLHSSGALSSSALEPFRKAGAWTASAHPLMSFVANSPASLAQVPVALEGDEAALRRMRPLLRRMKASIFQVEPENKAAYHAFSSFASPLLIAYLTQMEAAGELAGLSRDEARKRAAAILRRTLENYLEKGPEAAFSGPLRRGDVGTILKHLQVLGKNADLKRVYRELAEAALKTLPIGNREKIEGILKSSIDDFKQPTGATSSEA